MAKDALTASSATLRQQTASRPAELADSHVHLDRYSARDVSAMLRRARRVGVRSFLAIGVDEASSTAAVELASGRRGVWAAVGVHPTSVGGRDLQATLAALRQLAGQPGVAAIGEVGLDETSTAPTAEQEVFFSAFIELASELRLALSLHVVGLHRRAQQMLAAGPRRPAVVHYFQGDAALAEQYLELGCYVSLGKPVLRAERQALHEAARRVPLERLLLETDTYPLPGRTTEPRDVAEICRALAELKQVSFEAVAEATTANFRRLFGRGEARPRSAQPTDRGTRRRGYGQFYQEHVMQADRGCDFDFLAST